MNPKTCTKCRRAAYTVKPYWSSEESYLICCNCNIEIEKCDCPVYNPIDLLAVPKSEFEKEHPPIQSDPALQKTQ